MLPSHIGKDFAAKLSEMIVEPDIPMPKLQRESVAGFVNSAFQSFICSFQDSDGLTLGYLE